MPVYVKGSSFSFLYGLYVPFDKPKVMSRKLVLPCLLLYNIYISIYIYIYISISIYLYIYIYISRIDRFTKTMCSQQKDPTDTMPPRKFIDKYLK